MNTLRRFLLGGSAAFGAAWLSGGARASDAVQAITDIAAPRLDPMPPVPTSRTPGKPGDFAFLTGEWRIRHRQPKPGSATASWIEFHGEATVHGLLAGVGSIEELRIPVRDFSGIGLRLLDLETRLWSDFWVNAKSGALSSPGVTGSFEEGVGLFISEDEDADGKVMWAGVWDLITPTSCRWRQALSRDRGASWKQVWLMDWRRA